MGARPVVAPRGFARSANDESADSRPIRFSRCFRSSGGRTASSTRTEVLIRVRAASINDWDWGSQSHFLCFVRQTLGAWPRRPDERYLAGTASCEVLSREFVQRAHPDYNRMRRGGTPAAFGVRQRLRRSLLERSASVNGQYQANSLPDRFFQFLSRRVGVRPGLRALVRCQDYGAPHLRPA